MRKNHKPEDDNRRYCIYFVLLLGIFLLPIQSATSQTLLKPFVLASLSNVISESSFKENVDIVRHKLALADFFIAGDFQPYSDAHIFVITNDQIIELASRTEQGGYFSALRVTLTQVDNEIQLSYSNPDYLFHAYRLEGGSGKFSQTLKRVLGFLEYYGAEKGMPKEKLRNYHYMFGMEYFDEPTMLGEFETHHHALSVLENGLSQEKAGVAKVYRIDMPNQNKSLFGVTMTRDCSSDEFLMQGVDFKPVRSTPHLPYELLVSENKIFTLHPHFRIAMNFPDLQMTKFMKMMCIPGDIIDALEDVVS